MTINELLQIHSSYIIGHRQTKFFSEVNLFSFLSKSELRLIEHFFIKQILKEKY